ncbi:Putative ribonuclease H protein At1g65750 [Linum perenne]
MIIKCGEGPSRWQPVWSLSGAGVSMWIWIVKASALFWDFGSVDPGGGWVSFWGDVWVSGVRFRESFPRVAAAAANPNAFLCEFVPECFREDWMMPLRLELRRGALMEYQQCVRLLRQVAANTVTEGPAAVKWTLSNSAVFSVKSLNAQLRNVKFPGSAAFPYGAIWIGVVPVKIQCFLWLCYHNRISTLDVLQTRGFSFPNWCVLCRCGEESVSHLFIHCPFVTPIWGKISSRLSIFGPLPSQVSELILGWKGLNCHPSFSALKKVVLHSFCWHVWLERNDAVFRDSTISATRVFYRMVVSCCAWLKVHARISQHDFEIWMRQLTAT